MTFRHEVRKAMDKHETNKLATALGVSPRTLQYWARGEKKPNGLARQMVLSILRTGFAK